MKLKCKKNLFKSTYNQNAFTEGNEYEVVKEDDYIWVVDNTGREFNFSSTEKHPFYYIKDYFQ